MKAVVVAPEVEAEISDRLGGLVGVVNLIVDGTPVMAAKSVVGKDSGAQRLVILVYVDGFVRGQWIDNPTAIVRTVWRKHERYLLTKKEREQFRKLDRLLKRKTDVDRKIVQWVPDFPSVNAFLQNLKRNAQTVELRNEDP